MAERGGSGRSEPRLLWLGLAVTVFLVTFLYRFLSAKFVNDHFLWISGGRQIVWYGAIPYRDFYDPGYFLQHYASAAVQMLFGDNLLGETLLSVFFLAAGAVLVFWLAARASRSPVLGLFAAGLVVVTFPRLYNYHKLFLYVFGLLLCWRYVDRPTPRRLALIGAATGFSFLFRHDHGVYIFVATVAMLVGLHGRDGWRSVARRLALYAGIVAVPVVAFLAFIGFVEPKGGAEQYVQSSTRFVSYEPDRSAVSQLPSFNVDFTAPLFEIAPPPPLPSADIQVRWSLEVTAEERAVLEQRYGLTSAAPLTSDPRGRTWQYLLLDPTTAKVGGLLEERYVEDTAGIDRSSGRPLTLPDEPLAASWQRALPLLRVRLAPGVLQPTNAAPWLYYLFFGMPAVALVLLMLDRLPARRTMDMCEWSKMLAIAALCAVATPVLVREPLDVRLADTAAPTAVLGAWLLARCRTALVVTPVACMTRARPFRGDWDRRVRRTVGLGALAVAVVMTMLSVASVGNLGRNLESSGILPEPRHVVSHALNVSRTLRASSIEEAPWVADRAVRALARYVHDCTIPSDKTLVAWWAPDFYFFSGRGFAGGQLYPREGRTFSLEQESVPIVIVNLTRRTTFDRDPSPVTDYLAAHHVKVLESTLGSDELYRVLVDGRMTPTGTYEPLSLPCYRR